MKRGLAYYKKRGLQYEFKVRKRFLDAGWYATRSAASHGLWDITAVHPKGDFVFLIQVKRVQDGAAFRDSNWEKLRALRFPPGVTAMGMVFRGKDREPQLLEFTDGIEESMNWKDFWNDIRDWEAMAYS